MKVYHHTSAAAADRIWREQRLTSAGEPHVYVTTVDYDIGYGDTVVPIEVAQSRLQRDDEFPDGRQDYAISVPRGSRGVPVKAAKPYPARRPNPQKDTIRAALQRATDRVLAPDGPCDIGEINAGWCDRWAEAAEAELARAGVHAKLLATVEDDDMPFHVFLKIGRRYYDSEAPGGVPRLGALPIFKRAAHTGVRRVQIEPW